MKMTFTCAVRQPNQVVKWAHVQAEDTGVAIQVAVQQVHAKGRCAVEVYHGKSIPFHPEETPAAMATVMA
jgi:hypothetical protein